MNAFITLLKREKWENNNAFMVMPIVIGGLLLLVAICSFILFFIIKGIDITQSVNIKIVNQENIKFTLYAIASPFALILWLTVIYYFAHCLFNERKDGSILFWQSMPISQIQTLLSKIITGVFLAPFIAWIIFILTQIGLFIIASISLPFLGMSMNVSMLWQPLTLFSGWFSILIAFYIQSIWLLPVFAWFMFCGALAKRRPILLAIVPIIVVSIIEKIIGVHWYIFHFVTQRVSHVMHVWLSLLHTLRITRPLATESTGLFNIWQLLKPNNMAFTEFLLDIFIGFLIAFIFIYLAALLRYRCYDIER